MPAEIAMTPFLQQILQEIDKRAEAESGGDPTRRIQITKALTDQVTRPVLEAAIGRSGQRMGSMAGQQARALSQTAASQRVGESAMEYDMMNSEANAALTKKSAAWSAGAAMGAGLIGNWPEQAAYEPSKYRPESVAVAAPPVQPVAGEWDPARFPASELAAKRQGAWDAGTPQQAQQYPPAPQTKQMHSIADKLRRGVEVSNEEMGEWESLPDSVKNFALGGQPDSRLGQLFGGK